MSKPKFQVGDHVVVKHRGFASNYDGRKGIVTKTKLIDNVRCYKVEFDDTGCCPLYLTARELDFVSETQPKYKVGDHVIIKNQEGVHCILNGYEAVVERVTCTSRGDYTYTVRYLQSFVGTNGCFTEDELDPTPTAPVFQKGDLVKLAQTAESEVLKVTYKVDTKTIGTITEIHTMTNDETMYDVIFDRVNEEGNLKPIKLLLYGTQLVKIVKHDSQFKKGDRVYVCQVRNTHLDENTSERVDFVGCTGTVELALSPTGGLTRDEWLYWIKFDCDTENKARWYWEDEIIEAAQEQVIEHTEMTVKIIKQPNWVVNMTMMEFSRGMLNKLDPHIAGVLITMVNDQK